MDNREATVGFFSKASALREKFQHPVMRKLSNIEASDEEAVTMRLALSHGGLEIANMRSLAASERDAGKALDGLVTALSESLGEEDRQACLQSHEGMNERRALWDRIETTPWALVLTASETPLGLFATEKEALEIGISALSNAYGVK